MMKVITIYNTGLLWLLLWSATGKGQQRYPEQVIPYQNRMVTGGKDGRIEAELISKDVKPPHADRRLRYSWYAKDSIRQTQGGYSGRLLHGAYLEMYPNRQFKVQGQFSHGLKDGTWSYWDPDGTLRKSSTWRGGRETGKFRVYNEQGVLQQEGRLKDGKYEGIVRTYHHTDSAYTEKRNYRGGIEKPLSKKSWLRFLHKQQ